MSSNSQYAVVSVEKTETPEGMKGNNWHKYVIERGRGQSVVTGKKPGTLKQVTQHAKQVAEYLNNRYSKNSSVPYGGRRITKTP